MENVIELKKCTAEAKYTIKKSKKESWKNYVQTLTADIPITKVWNKIRKIKNKFTSSNFPIIKDNAPLLDNKSKSNAFVEHFASFEIAATSQIPIDFMKQ